MLLAIARGGAHFIGVREPIARFASEFAQWKDRSHWLQDAHSAALRARWANITLEGYARHADCPAHNRMAWMLGAPQPPNDDSTRPSPSDFAPFWRAHYGGADDYVARLNEDEGVLTRESLKKREGESAARVSIVQQTRSPLPSNRCVKTILVVRSSFRPMLLPKLKCWSI